MGSVAWTINILQSSYDNHHKWCLYYKRVIALAFALAGVINYAPRVMLQIVASPMIVIYNCNMFIVEATGFNRLKLIGRNIWS